MKATSPDAAHALRLLAADLRLRTREHFSSPTVIEAAATAVAEALRGSRPEVVVTWESVEDAVLGYEVARQLGVRTAVVQEPQEGVLELSPALPTGARVSLLATSFHRMAPRTAAAALIEQRGGVLVTLASLVGPADGGDDSLGGPEHVVFVE